MRLPCDLIQDLLPLYHDEVCSQTSREAVKEHLTDCPDCQKVLDAMDEEWIPDNEKQKEKELRPLAEWWQKQKKKNHLNAIVYTMFLVIILGVGYYFATWYVYIPVSAEKIEVSHVYQLSDGRIVFNLYVEGGKNCYFWEYDGEGNIYLIPERSFPAIPDRGDSKWWNNPIEFYIPQNKGDTLLPDTVTTELAYGTKAVYAGPVGKGILVWQEGDVVPKASQQWEEMIKAYHTEFSNEYYEFVSKN